MTSDCCCCCCCFIFVDRKEEKTNLVAKNESEMIRKNKQIVMKYIFNNCLYFCQEANTVKIFSENKQIMNIYNLRQCQ